MDFGQVTKIEDDACVIELQYSPEDTLYDGLDFPLEDSYTQFLLDHSDIMYVTDCETYDYKIQGCYQLIEHRSFIGIKLVIDGQIYGGLIFSDMQ